MNSGLPFSAFFRHLTPWNKCPTRTVVLTTTIIWLLSLINIGSTTAFNALLSLSTLGIYFSYCIPIVVIALRRFDRINPIEFGPWYLGKSGLAINIVSIIFCLFVILFLPFPPELPVTANNMNYSSVMFLGVIGFAIIYYFTFGKHTYKGPVEVIVDESDEKVE